MADNSIIPEGRGLGRRAKLDPRDLRFRLSLPTRQSERMTRVWSPSKSHPWDQGDTSECVSFSTNAFLACSPYRNVVPPKSKDAWFELNAEPDIPTQRNWLTVFYNYCRTVDEWTGEDYDGTSVRAAMKTLQKLGYITEYKWAFDLPTCLNYVLEKGPMVVGTDWTYPMFEPVKEVKFNAFIRVFDTDLRYRVAGGHAYLLIGANRNLKCPDGTKGAFRILNSWGKDWGENGRAWIAFSEFTVLLNHGGEAAAATEVLRP